MKNLPVSNISRRGCSPLSPEEYKKLKEIGVDFKDRIPAKQKTWDKSFSELEALKAKYKHFNVPARGEYQVSCQRNMEATQLVR
jgi:hypothetical protein